MSKAGKAQAQALPDLLRGIGGDQSRLVSSPWVRCIETLAPLAAVLGLAVDTNDVLGEGMGDKAVEALPRWMDGPSAVFCTHGDVVERLLAEPEHLLLAAQGQERAVGPGLDDEQVEGVAAEVEGGEPHQAGGGR